jgi:hypothetical protein
MLEHAGLGSTLPTDSLVAEGHAEAPACVSGPGLLANMASVQVILCSPSASLWETQHCMHMNCLAFEAPAPMGNAPPKRFSPFPTCHAMLACSSCGQKRLQFRTIKHDPLCSCSSAAWAPFVAAIVPGLNALHLFLVGAGTITAPALVSSVSRSEDRTELIRGPCIYAVVLFVATILSWRGGISAPCIVAMMCGGDGVADLVGRRLGQHKLPWSAGKSWAGSIAMFAVGLTLSCWCAANPPLQASARIA